MIFNHFEDMTYRIGGLDYHLGAILVFLALVIAVNVVGNRLLFMIPALRENRARNREMDREKAALPKYATTVRQSKVAGLAINLIFLLVVGPLVLTLTPQPWWRYLVDIVVILMVYDAFYYLTHRFLFHGKGWLRRVHGRHHQARSLSTIDGYYVHPVETAIGLGLYQLTVVLYVLAVPDHSLHAVSAALTTLIYVAINVINHVDIDLPTGPFKPFHWMAAKHAVHHENMHKGNYATITLLYDKLFGTLE